MADVAQGVQSSCCGTFSTVAGSFSDETLAGTCGRCGGPISAPNAQYVPPAACPNCGYVSGGVPVSPTEPVGIQPDNEPHSNLEPVAVDPLVQPGASDGE